MYQLKILIQVGIKETADTDENKRIITEKVAEILDELIYRGESHLIRSQLRVHYTCSPCEAVPMRVVCHCCGVRHMLAFIPDKHRGAPTLVSGVGAADKSLPATPTHFTLDMKLLEPAFLMLIFPAVTLTNRTSTPFLLAALL